MMRQRGVNLDGQRAVNGCVNHRQFSQRVSKCSEIHDVLRRRGFVLG